LLIGLTGMFDWRMHGAAYTSQVKDKLSSKVDKEVYDAILPELEKYFSANPSVAKNIIKRAQAVTKGRLDLAAVVKSMADVKKKGKGNTLPAALAAATKCKPHERELFIVEGDSAKGPSVNARNRYNQEVLAASGKPLNALTAPLSKVLAHKEIGNMLIALGADLKTLDPKDENPKISTEKLRAGNIIFLVDPDPDGGHIAVLFMAALYRLLPDLFKEGRVWCVQAPLFAALHEKKIYGGMTFAECRAAAPKAVKDGSIVRIKGWGEVNETYVGPIAFKPEQRKLIRIDAFEHTEQERFFRGVVAEDAVHRRRLLGLED
jgi:DNA gyrase subunit B